MSIKSASLLLHKAGIFLMTEFSLLKFSITLLLAHHLLKLFPRWLSGKEAACQGRRCRRLWLEPWVREDPLEEEMATHSSMLAWRSPWTEEPGSSPWVTKSPTWLSIHACISLKNCIFQNFFKLDKLSLYCCKTSLRIVKIFKILESTHWPRTLLAHALC